VLRIQMNAYENYGKHRRYTKSQHMLLANAMRRDAAAADRMCLAHAYLFAILSM